MFLKYRFKFGVKNENLNVFYLNEERAHGKVKSFSHPKMHSISMHISFAKILTIAQDYNS